MADAVGFVFHPRIDPDEAHVREARARLAERGFRVWTHRGERHEKPGALLADLDGTRLLVSVGGDGTLLWTAQQAAPARVPVLSVNAGRLGFLTQVQLNQIVPAIEQWIAGDFTLQQRALLKARQDGADPGHLALNDVVVHKGVEFNLIRIEVTVDGADAGRFDADGAVVATGTGSTGYALSLGGPILHPEIAALVFMPLNPHSLFNRPIVVPESSRVRIRLLDAAGVLSCDGQMIATLQTGAEVEVSSAGTSLDLVRLGPERNFFELLRLKLHWGTPLTDNP